MKNTKKRMYEQRFIKTTKCAYCGTLEADFEIDHIKPTSEGGLDIPENMVVACHNCNRTKKSVPFIVWMKDIDGSLARFKRVYAQQHGYEFDPLFIL